MLDKPLPWPNRTVVGHPVLRFAYWLLGFKNSRGFMVLKEGAKSPFGKKGEYVGVRLIRRFR